VEVNAFLADAAEESQGKIYALGIGWNRIYTREFPARHPRMAIAITVHVPYTQTNQVHRISIQLETEDGQVVPLGDAPPSAPDEPPGKIHELGGEFNVGRPPNLTPGDEQIVPLALTLDGLRFEQPGKFNWVIRIDGTEVRRLDMRVEHLMQLGTVR
jgi:hypothetical protein